MKRAYLLLTTLSIAIAGCQPEESGPVSSVGTDQVFSAVVDEQGNISRPTGFRENWTHLGSWYVTSDGMSGGATMHDVYATPESVKGFKDNGQWPDGTVLVKTVSSLESRQLTTGHAQWTGTPAVWFVMVRDRQNRFPENKAWGEGWGWALFEAKDPDKNLTTDWRGTGFNNCFGCHTPARNTEWVYIDGYPTVRDSAHYPQPVASTDMSMHD